MEHLRIWDFSLACQPPWKLHRQYDWFEFLHLIVPFITFYRQLILSDSKRANILRNIIAPIACIQCTQLTFIHDIAWFPMRFVYRNIIFMQNINLNLAINYPLNNWLARIYHILVWYRESFAVQFDIEMTEQN